MTGHQLHQLLRRRILHGQRRHALTVTQDTDAVADAAQLIHAMTHIQNAHALLAKALDVFKQRLRLTRCERGGRFIEDEQTALLRQGGSEFDELLLTDPERGR